MFVCVLHKVLTKVGRRSGYKGNINSLRLCFPLDVTTLPAVTGCIGVILGAKGLSRDLIDTAYKVFKGVSENAMVTACFRLLPDKEVCWLDLNEGKVPKHQVKRLLDNIGLGFSRLVQACQTCFLQGSNFNTYNIYSI